MRDHRRVAEANSDNFPSYGNKRLDRGSNSNFPCIIPKIDDGCDGYTRRISSKECEYTFRSSHLDCIVDNARV